MYKHIHNVCFIFFIFMHPVSPSPVTRGPPNSQNRHPVPPVNTAGMGLWCKSGPWMQVSDQLLSGFCIANVRGPLALEKAVLGNGNSQASSAFLTNREKFRNTKQIHILRKKLSESWNQKEFPFNFPFTFLINWNFSPRRSSINLNLIAKTFQAFCLLEIKLIKN